MEKLHDFEEECAEDYFREKEIQLQSSSNKRIQVINERLVVKLHNLTFNFLTYNKSAADDFENIEAKIWKISKTAGLIAEKSLKHCGK